MYTTLNKIRERNPCSDGWAKLLTHLGKTVADDDPLSILTILDSNGLDDALWALRAVDGHDREIRLYAVWCARQVQHLMTGQRSIDALDVAERYARGEATDKQLAAAWDAAADAAEEAKASASAWAATRAAAWAAAVAAKASAEESADESAAWAAWEAWEAAVTAEAADAAEAAKKSQEAELRRVCKELEGK